MGCLRTRSLLVVALVATFLGVLAPAAAAGTILVAAGQTADGRDVSGTADVTIAAGQVTITLTNTTGTTYTAGELLTGFRFDIAGVSSLSLSAATTPNGRTVASNGTFSDTAGSVNLLTAKSGNKATWQVGAHGSGFQLDFNPDAKYGILGGPTGGDYTAANGSIKGNNGHNPFANGSATFTLSSSAIGADASFSGAVFLFGTDFATELPTAIVPLPLAAWSGLLLLGGLAAARRRRRRDRPAAG